MRPPSPNEKCIVYNGWEYVYQFAFVNGTMPESRVQSHNIIAVHSKNAQKYKVKTLRIKQGSRQIDAKCNQLFKRYYIEVVQSVNRQN